ncbi:MAG TPA: MoxR family ATPase [Rhizomicrobium sp.]|nr:MoxR family ATPase [Rhizomicrobium sp.]
MEDPAGYRPHPELSHAVNVALVLGMPLLLTGEPGTGKTQLAYAIGEEIGCPIFKFETKSTSQARDLFYTFDALSAFKMRDDTDPRLFIRYHALGSAILDCFSRDDPRVAALLPPGAEHAGPRRSIVLIDEIDKAPRDFPNDLLNEIERLYFRVPELMNIGSPGAEQDESGIPRHLRPIIVMTSNSEKGLPDAFLRRCVYFDIPFPSVEEIKEIVGARVAGLDASSPLLADALDLFQKLRGSDRTISLKKKPSTAELLNWLQMLIHRGAGPRDSLRDRKQLIEETLCILVKSSDDRREAQAFVAERWGGSQPK